MGDRHGGREAGKCAAKCTRRVALNREQSRPVSEKRADRPGHLVGMGVRVGPARAVQGDATISVEPMFRRTERMLGCEDQPRLQAAASQCGGDGR